MKKNKTFKAAAANILVTGGAGFIGSNCIRQLLGLAVFKGRIINYDKLTYAGNLASLKDVARKYGPARPRTFSEAAKVRAGTLS